MAGRLVALRAAGRIAARDARRSKGRTIMVAAMIGLPLLIGTAGGTLLNSLEPTPEQMVQDILGETAQAEISAWRGSFIDQGAMGEWASRGWGSDADAVPPADVAAHEEAIAAVLPEGTELVRTLTGRGTATSEQRSAPYAYDVVEVPAAHIADLTEASLHTGRVPNTVGELLLTTDAASALDVEVGDTVTIEILAGEPVTGTVVGILTRVTWGREITALTGTVVPDPDTVEEDIAEPRWLVYGDTPITWDDVSRLNDAGSFVLSRYVVLNPDTVVSGIDESSYVEPGAVAVVGAVVAIVLIEAVLLIGPAFAVGAQRSQRQLAMIAATGGEARTLRRVVLFGGVTTGLVASATAVVLGLAIAAVFVWVVNTLWPAPFPGLRVPWLVLPPVIALGTLLATAAAWLPARRAGRLDVVAALAGRRAEAHPRRRVAIIGAVIAGIGVVAAVAGASASQPSLVVAGVIALEIGIVATAGAIIALVARLAPRLGVAGRFALRDAARQRARTAPAVAAIIAALAGATAGAAYITSSEAQRDATYIALGPDGTVVAGINRWEEDAPAVSTEELDSLGALVSAILPIDELYIASMATPVSPDLLPDDEIADLRVQWPGGDRCPLDETDSPSNTQIQEHADDPRCYRSMWQATSTLSPSSGGGVLVDDGTIVAGLGFAGADEAGEALRAGRVVVESRHAIHPDGTVHIDDERYVENEDGTVVASYELAATAVDLGGTSSFGVVLPPQVAEELGLHVEEVGLLASTSRTPTRDEEYAAYDTFHEMFEGGAFVGIERGSGNDSYAVWIVVIAAAIVGLGATSMSIALAQAETRPDLATLAAVGASPGVRRRIAAAQAGVLTLIGGVLGTGTGLLLATVIVTTMRYQHDQVDPTWQLLIPWPAVAGIALGVPLLSMGAAWLVTRSRLPMVHRLVG